MNDNQRIFLAFFILVVAALNANSTILTGHSTKGTSISSYAPLAATAALTYCAGKGDLDGDGVFTEDDLELANQYFTRGGDYLRKLPIATKEIMDVYPVEQGNCGDGQLTLNDLKVLSYMRED